MLVIFYFCLYFQISPAVTVIAMFLVDERAHQKMISICKGARRADEDKKKE